MGRFVKSDAEILGREHQLFSSLPYGPIVVQCHQEAGVTAKAADGTRIELSATTVFDRRMDRAQFRDGIAVLSNGQAVGKLSQTEHGLMRSDRVLHLSGHEPGRFPVGAHFRLRGTGYVSFEAEGTRLVRYYPLLNRGRVAAGVSSELVALFAAVHIGLREPMEQAVSWKTEEALAPPNQPRPTDQPPG